MELKFKEVFSNILCTREMSLTQISKDLKIPVSTLSDWTAGTCPSKNLLRIKNLSFYLGVSFHYLLFGEEDEIYSERTGRALKKIIRTDILKMNLRTTPLDIGKNVIKFEKRVLEIVFDDEIY